MFVHPKLDIKNPHIIQRSEDSSSELSERSSNQLKIREKYSREENIKRAIIRTFGKISTMTSH